MRELLRKLMAMSGYSVRRIPRSAYPEASPKPYDEDGLRTAHNHSFLTDPEFRRAYDRGIAAATDLRWRWRVHIGLWAAHSASKLRGDFVECGVGRGFLSSAIMAHLNWDELGKRFYLLDTFSGLDERYVSEEELREGAMSHSRQRLESGAYVSGAESVRANFSEWKNVRIIEGPVPETLRHVDAESIAYLHLDMNCAPPEVAALDFFWERLTPGAVVLLDDYAYLGYESQFAALNAAAAAKSVRIASLPSGQGLLLKPPDPGAHARGVHWEAATETPQ